MRRVSRRLSLVGCALDQHIEDNLENRLAAV